jgi:hypothetical protein
MKNRNVVLVLGLFFAGFLILNLNLSGSGYTNQFNAILDAATILFGMFIAFSIYNNQNKLSRLKELLREDDAHIISLYKLTGGINDKVQSEIKELIDDYLILQIDYMLTDFRHSSKQFNKIYEYIISIEPKTDKQTKIYEAMLEVSEQSFENRKLIEVLVVQKMTALEWVCLFALEIVIAFSLFSFNYRNLFESIFTSILATSGIALLIVLRKLDELDWQEHRWIWTPLNNLFLSLDLLPYYPDAVLSEKRAILPRNQKIRVCHYHKPYPDMTGNEIEIVELK